MVYNLLPDMIYNLLPDWTTDTFWECLESKGCSKISKIPKKIFAKVCLFLERYSSAVQNFWHQQMQTPRKLFPLSTLK